MNDYDGLGEDLKQRAGSPYVLAARARAGAIARWCEKQGVEDKVAYVFEGGDPRFREALAQIVEESDDFKNRMWIGSIVAGSKPEAAPLRMAGILAWEVTRHAPRRLGFDSTRPRCSMERLLDTVPLETAYFDARALRMMAVRHAPEDYKRSAEMFGMAMRADPGSTGAGCVRR